MDKKYEMTVKDLINHLKNFEPTARVLIACDEELNTIYKGLEVAVYGDDDDTTKDIVIYGLSGMELDE
jgi:hypothetical protein